MRAALTRLCLHRINESHANLPGGWTHPCVPAFASVSQRNPLGQVMWVSNPLEGYRIPSLSTARPWRRLPPGAEGPVKTRSRSDGEPTPRCSGPWLSSTHRHGGCTPRGLQPPPPPQRNAIQMYAAACSRTCSVTAKTPQGRAKEGSTQIKTLPATVCLWGSGSFHYCSEIHSNPTKPPSANDMASQRTHSFIWGTLMKRQAAVSPMNCYSTGAAA